MGLRPTNRREPAKFQKEQEHLHDSPLYIPLYTRICLEYIGHDWDTGEDCLENHHFLAGIDVVHHHPNQCCFSGNSSKLTDVLFFTHV
jgi:hypothetical protein